MRHECSLHAGRTEAQVSERLLHIRDVMVACEDKGMSRDGYLPGNLGVRRRAKDWFVRLAAEDPHRDPAFAAGLGELGGACRQRGERRRAGAS